MSNSLADFAAVAAVPFLGLCISLIPLAILEWLEERQERPQKKRRRRR